MSDITEYEAITSKNSIYQEHESRWKYLLESYVGGDMYQRGQHLTRYAKENEGEYQARIRATPLDNHCRGVISIYNSFLFRECPDREFGSIENLPELEDFLRNADYENRSLDNFMKEVSTWAGVFGHCWVMVSKPDIGAVTRADEIASGVRPYVSLMTPLVVTDWNWKRSRTGRYELDLFKYIEEINGNIQTIKRWTLETIETIIVDTEKFQVQSKEVVPNRLGLIPAVISYNARSIVRGIGTSAINDIADQQKFIYNATSEVDQSMRLDSHPSLVVEQGTNIGVGAGAIIEVGTDSDPQKKPYVLDFAGASISSIYEAINASIASIEKMANIGSVRATESKTMSGVAMETEFQLLNARLSEMADNLELTEEQIWRLWCMYQAQPFDVEIEYPGSFNMRDTGAEIDQLKKASETTQDPLVQAAIAAEVLDWLDVDEDELAILKTELEVQTSTTEPVTPTPEQVMIAEVAPDTTEE